MIELINNSLYLVNNDKKTSLLNGGDVSFSYTLKSEDIKTQTRCGLTPYVSHMAQFDELKDATFSKKNIDDGLEISLNVKSDIYSEWGVNLPFNFMSKKNGGGYQNQYLFNSPYKDEDCTNNYLYLSNPNGQNLLIVLKTEHAYWKMDYSPYCGGHFFINLKILGQMDKVYMPDYQNNHELTFYIVEVKDFEEALDKVAAYLGKPVLSYDLSGGKIGTSINVKVRGNIDSVKDGEEEIKVSGNSFKFEIKKEGVTTLTPYFKGQKGLSCTLYGYSTIADLYRKSVEAFDRTDIDVTDGNLCEHQCYVSATLRYLLKYGKNAEYEKIVLDALSIICETDPSKAKERITVLDKEQDTGLPAYHIYHSKRIQEQFFGVTIFLDAYKYFEDEKYLGYAVNSLNTLIDNYQKPDGGFYTKMDWNQFEDDYSTVTCLIIPVIDMANFFKDKDVALANKYKESARKLAEHVYERGLNFPTESIVSEEYDPEMEDGSISCSALTLLYYHNNIEKNEAYVAKAKEILEFHESWVVNSPLCYTYRSSLRWWETGWEGDQDGPALCMGHAWTIWRAEADFWMYKATGNESYLLKAKNSFNTNFAKINAKGQSFSMYCIDYITGGGFEGRVKLKYRIAPKFPDQKDSGLTRYVWIRASETILDYLK